MRKKGVSGEEWKVTPPNKRFYKVAFSFASGKNDIYRNFVRSVAEILRDTHNVPQELIFFDEWVDLCGRTDADSVLYEIYKERSEFIVPFFSKEYLEKYWNHGVEYKVIQIVNIEHEGALIPASFDMNLKIAGFPCETTLFLNCFEKGPKIVAEAIFRRLREATPRQLVAWVYPGKTYDEKSDNNDFSSANNAQTRVKAFISYSHEDKDGLKKLKSALAMHCRFNKLELWSDHAINAGDIWEEQIFNKLRDADIVLCLISQDFIASDFCHKELETALKNHDQGKQIVVPILWRECYWDDLSIAKLQGTPLKWIKSQDDMDSAWTEVAKKFKLIIDKVKERTKNS